MFVDAHARDDAGRGDFQPVIAVATRISQDTRFRVERSKYDVRAAIAIHIGRDQAATARHRIWPLIMKAADQKWGGDAFAAPARGWERLYIDHVTQADTGADLDFLIGSSGDKVARETIYINEGWEAPDWRAPWRTPS